MTYTCSYCREELLDDYCQKCDHRLSSYEISIQDAYYERKYLEGIRTNLQTQLDKANETIKSLETERDRLKEINRKCIAFSRNLIALLEIDDDEQEQGDDFKTRPIILDLNYTGELPLPTDIGD